MLILFAIFFSLQMDHHGPLNSSGQTGGQAGPIMSSSMHRRSLQDVDALGLFHHGRGVGRHLTRQSSSTDDSRRRSSANLHNLHNASSVTHLAGSLTGRTLTFFQSQNIEAYFIHLLWEITNKTTVR